MFQAVAAVPAVTAATVAAVAVAARVVAEAPVNRFYMSLINNKNKDKFRSCLICSVFFLFTVITPTLVFAQTETKNNGFTLDKDILSVKGGLLYTFDSERNLVTVDLQTQKINRVQIGGFGIINNFVTEFAPELLFINTGTSRGSSLKTTFVMDKTAVEQGLTAKDHWDLVMFERAWTIPVFNSKTNKIYISNRPDKELLIYDVNFEASSSKKEETPFLKLAMKIPLGAIVDAMAISQQRNKVFILSSDPGRLFIIDGLTDKPIIRTVSLPGQPQTLTMDEQNGRLFITSRVVDKLLVFDTDKEEIIKTIDTAAGPGSVFLDKDTGKFYLLSNDAGVLTVFDSALAPRVIALGEFANYSSSPLYLSVNTELKRVYVLNAFTSSLFIVD
ncbi:hypothetical protein KKH14_00585, partial [Patescibacteria group bacterium]|nr:hypothetical protein [Patescibacteria group bacterium]